TLDSAKLSARGEETLLAEQVRNLNRSLVLYQSSRDLNDFFIRAGGLFNLYSTDAYNRYQAIAARAKVATGNQILADIRVDVSQIAERMQQYFVVTQAGKLSDRLADLRKDAEKARAEADSLSRQDKRIITIGTKLGGLVGQVGAVYTNISEGKAMD